MANADEPKRIKTYVKGLDENLQRGVPENSVILLAGPPGTMKSSMGFYILYNNVKENDDRAVYISLEESRDSLIGNMSGLGMDWSTVDRKLSILDLGLIRSRMSALEDMDWLNVFKMYVKNLKENLDNDFLVIDSLPILETMADFEEPRKDLFNFFEWLRNLEVTTFVIHEMPVDGLVFSDSSEGFLSDGVIHLELRREDTNMDLFLSVVKMRKTKHSRDYYPLIYEDGFELVKG